MVCGRPPSRHFPRGTFIWTNQIRGIKMGKGLLLWLIGIPIPIIAPWCVFISPVLFCLPCAGTSAKAEGPGAVIGRAGA